MGLHELSAALRATARSRRIADAAKYPVKRLLARRGWHIGRMEIDWTRDVYLSRLFKAFDVNCVVDVGGRIGDYGLLLRRAGYTGRIVSFEPVTASFQQLQQRAANDQRWITFPYALGSSRGSTTINVMQETVFSSMLQPSTNGNGGLFPGNSVERQETVEIRRLDGLFSDITRGLESPRVYLKMDTQGWDLEVFRGAEGCLKDIVALQSELSVRPIYEGMPPFQQALDLYRAAGFVESAFFRETRDPFWRLVEFDCIMVRDAHQPVPAP